MKMDSFTNRILGYMREQELAESGDTIVVGFSGGADSVCLLQVLRQLSRILGISLRAVHVNHGIRGPEADRDEEFCRNMAEELGIPFEAVRVNVPEHVTRTGMTEEEAGRILRYEALNRAASEADAGGRVLIATAHHADDQAETILLNMLRGSGLRGLGGMRPKRDNIIRPLLTVSRYEITEYLSSLGIGHVEDFTNFENDHTRNRLRNIILPQLKEHVNSRASQHIAFSGGLAMEADEYIASEAAAFLDAGGRIYEDGYGKALKLGQRKLKEKAQIFRRYVIIEALRRLGVPMKDWGEKHFADIDSALFKPKGCHVDLPGDVFAENEYKETVLHIRRREESNVNI